MAAAQKIQLQQEVYEDSPQNGSPKLSRNSILRKSSSGAGSRSSNPKGPARRVISRGYSASKAVKGGANKIEDLFDNHFEMGPSEYAQVVDAARYAANRGEPATCKEMNALKDTLLSVLGDIDSLKAKCTVVEERYKDAIITASQELQNSMNILFQLQQKTANLQDSSANVEKLSDELKMAKLRLASKDKERRIFKAESESKDKIIEDQAAQIKEMNAMLGGTSEELAQRSIDAKRANALWEDLSNAKNKIKDLKAENGRLTTRAHELEGLLQEGGGGDTVALHQRLQVAAAEKQNLQAEVSRLTDELTSCRNECNRLREAMGGGGDSAAAVQVERELRLQAEQRAEHERSEREAAEQEWVGMSAKVVAEVDQSRRRVEELTTHSTDIENKLTEARAETRKAQLVVAELNGTASSNYDIKVHTCVKGGSSASSKVKGSFLRVSSDGVSVKMSVPTLSSSEGEAAAPAVRKFFFDRVLHAGEEEFHGQVGGSMQGYMLAAMEGQYTAALVYGKSSAEKTTLTFGDAAGEGGLISAVLNYCAGRVKALASEWDFQVETTFVKIFEEEITDMFSEAPDEVKKHEIEKMDDGSIAITNVNLVPMNADDDEEIQSIAQLASGTYDIFSTADHGTESHYMFSVHVRAISKNDGTVKVGRLSVAHLCGLEVGASSRSLQCLHDVFAGIAKRQAHVPYRNSKLTYVLQSALSVGGSSLVLACVDGADTNSYDMAQNALAFASQAFECVISPPSSSSSTGSKLSKNIDGRKSKSSSAVKSVSSKTSSASKSKSISKSGTGSSSKVGKFKLNL